MPVAANYGRPAGTIDDPGGMGGANKARDEWWNRKADNDAQQGMVNGAAGYANQQAGLGQDRGPMAIEDQALSNQEASGAGGHQQGAIGLAGTLARGQQPSQAAMQLQAGLNQSSAMQQSMAAGARGGAALATAGANMGANTAALQQNAWTQGGLLRSRDMAAGRGMLGTGLGQQQAQDQQRLGQANQLGQFNADLNDKYSLGMGQAGVGLGGAANAQQQTDLAWHQGGMTPVEAQSEAQQQQQRWEGDAERQRVAARKEDE
jgi:hypothetical protein